MEGEKRFVRFRCRIRSVFIEVSHLEFSLVAQPRELSEMGYLPPFEGQFSLVTQTIDEYTGLGPIRNGRRTRGSRRTQNQVSFRIPHFKEKF